MYSINSIISVPFDFGDKKAADFSHSATSGRSDFRYSVFSNLLAANGLSKPFADGKSTGDSRFSGARGCSHLDGSKVTQHSRSVSFLLLTGNEATQDALLSTESIEVRPLVPKGILSVRQTGSCQTAFVVSLCGIFTHC